MNDSQQVMTESMTGGNVHFRPWWLKIGYQKIKLVRLTDSTTLL